MCYSSALLVEFLDTYVPHYCDIAASPQGIVNRRARQIHGTYLDDGPSTYLRNLSWTLFPSDRTGRDTSGVPVTCPVRFLFLFLSSNQCPPGSLPRVGLSGLFERYTGLCAKAESPLFTLYINHGFDSSMWDIGLD